MPVDYDTLPGANTANTQFPPRVLTASAKRGYRTVPVSFETGEQTTHKIWFLHAVKILGYRVQVTKAIAGTDAATLEFRNSAATRMTPNGLLTIAASTAIGAEANGSNVFTANNNVAAGDFMDIVALKTTAGGKATVYVEYELQ